MPKLRDEIPYSAFVAARTACERLNGVLLGRTPLDRADFDDALLVDFARRREFDKDDDVVVMTIN